MSRKHIRVIVPVPKKKAENLAVVREELAHHGLSVIIARRACVRYAKEIKANKREHEEHDEPDCANCTGSCR